MSEPIIIPELDPPPVTGAANPVSLDRCWVWDGECHPTREAAVTRILDRFEETDDVDLLFIAPRQVDTPHVSLRCASCDRPLGTHDADHVHWRSLEQAEQAAGDQDWTTDGLRWNCDVCPPLQRPGGA